MPETEVNKSSNWSGAFSSILEILVNKISRKASVIALAMMLIYMLAATPAVAIALSEVMVYVLSISCLAIVFTVLQYRIDVKDRKMGYRPEESSDDSGVVDGGGAKNDVKDE